MIEKERVPPGEVQGVLTAGSFLLLDVELVYVRYLGHLDDLRIAVPFKSRNGCGSSWAWTVCRNRRSPSASLSIRSCPPVIRPSFRAFSTVSLRRPSENCFPGVGMRDNLRPDDALFG